MRDLPLLAERYRAGHRGTVVPEQLILIMDVKSGEVEPALKKTSSDYIDQNKPHHIHYTDRRNDERQNTEYQKNLLFIFPESH